MYMQVDSKTEDTVSKALSGFGPRAAAMRTDDLRRCRSGLPSIDFDWSIERRFVRWQNLMRSACR